MLLARLSRQLKPTSLRTFTTTATMAQKSEWLVILPDRPNALADRMKVRPYV